MLKQRIVTAILLVAGFLGGLFLLPVAWFLGLITVGLLLAGWEWAKLSGLIAVQGRATYVALLFCLIAFGAWWLWAADDSSARERLHDVIVVGSGWWALSLLWVQGYPSSAVLWGSRAARALMGLFVLIPAWAAAVILLHEPAGGWLLLLVVAIVACADIGGYFVGRQFGRHKLAPAVSPGKTIEGLLGGLIANALFALVLYYGVGWRELSLVALAVTVLCVSLVSVLGDLFESMVKRHAGVKDSGVILPGHGGVLDRIDGLVAALPVFTLIYLALENA